MQMSHFIFWRDTTFVWVIWIVRSFNCWKIFVFKLFSNFAVNHPLSSEVRRKNIILESYRSTVHLKWFNGTEMKIGLRGVWVNSGICLMLYLIWSSETRFSALLQMQSKTIFHQHSFTNAIWKWDVCIIIIHLFSEIMNE